MGKVFELYVNLPVFFLAVACNIRIRLLFRLTEKSRYLPDSLIWIRASPDNSSRAASETFRSDFHVEINR